MKSSAPQTSTESEGLPEASLPGLDILARLEPLPPQEYDALEAFRAEFAPTIPEVSRLHSALERIVDQESDCVVVGITSATAGEGKTTIALQLAVATARNTYKRVCLVDYSLGDDAVFKKLEFNGSASGEQQGAEQPPYAMRIVVGADSDFVLLRSGGTPAEPARTARSPRFPKLLETLRHSFNVVIVDLPAVSTGNCFPLAQCLDGVVMVMQAGVTPYPIVRSAVEEIGEQRVLGLVLNQVQDQPSRRKK